MIDKLAAIEARLRAAARRHWSYRLEPVGKDALWRMRIPARGRETARICLTAGTRGDAPAGVEAALRLLETGAMPPGVALDAFPVLSPDAVARGTREDGDGRDLGSAFTPGPGWPSRARDFARAVEGAGRYALHVDLLEDPRLTGGLVLAPDGNGLGKAIARAWSAEGLPLAAVDQARRALTADGLAVAQARAGDGWVDAPFATLPRDGGQPASFMRTRAADQALALHAPGRADWELRVRTHLAGLKAALAALADPRFADLASTRHTIVPFRPGQSRAW